jgi:hypothetical protein
MNLVVLLPSVFFGILGGTLLFSYSAVKLSGPVLFFVGRFFITVSILLLVIDVLKLYVLLVHFGGSYMVRNLSISS